MFVYSDNSIKNQSNTLPLRLQNPFLSFSDFTSITCLYNILCLDFCASEMIRFFTAVRPATLNCKFTLSAGGRIRASGSAAKYFGGHKQFHFYDSFLFPAVEAAEGPSQSPSHLDLD